jgi:hypothetical protein
MGSGRMGASYLRWQSAALARAWINVHGVNPVFNRCNVSLHSMIATTFGRHHEPFAV